MNFDLEDRSSYNPSVQQQAVPKLYQDLRMLQDKVLNHETYDKHGRKCGVISDVLLSPSSGYKPKYVEITGTWGILGFPRTNFVCPFEKLSIREDATLQIDDIKQHLLHDPSLKMDKIYEDADLDYFSLRTYLGEEEKFEQQEETDFKVNHSYFIL